MADTVYQFTVKDIDGKDVCLERYRGLVLCIVNVASKWGKTDVNYTGMVQLAAKYPQLRILLFPCNQFGGQEPGGLIIVYIIQKELEPSVLWLRKQFPIKLLSLLLSEAV